MEVFCSECDELVADHALLVVGHDGALALEPDPDMPGGYIGTHIACVEMEADNDGHEAGWSGDEVLPGGGGRDVEAVPVTEAGSAGSAAPSTGERAGTGDGAGGWLALAQWTAALSELEGWARLENRRRQRARAPTARRVRGMRRLLVAMFVLNRMGAVDFRTQEHRADLIGARDARTVRGYLKEARALDLISYEGRQWYRNDQGRRWHTPRYMPNFAITPHILTDRTTK